MLAAAAAHKMSAWGRHQAVLFTGAARHTTCAGQGHPGCAPAHAPSHTRPADATHASSLLLLGSSAGHTHTCTQPAPSSRANTHTTHDRPHAYAAAHQHNHTHAHARTTHKLHGTRLTPG
jgi:hypothetical protein